VKTPKALEGLKHWQTHEQRRRYQMNWDQIAGRWKQVKGNVKSEWGRLTDDDVDQVDGQQDKLIGRVQERYGVEREEAERQVSNWFSRL
jgi:uncharacterized protein YjbJ (UPF0337 family)|tara:strand:+ start:20921 stop:21187 length:267 start_codon:yes stop_codon:yes gene_type:complete